MIRIHEQCGSKTKRVFCILSVLFILISLKFLIWSFTTVEFNIAPPKAFTSAMKGFSTMAPSTTITSLSTMAPSTTIASLSTMAPSTIITSLSTKAPSTIITSLSTMASSAIITSLSTMASSTIITSLSTMVPSTTITNSITTTSNQSTLPPPATISNKFRLTAHCNNGRIGNQMGTYATLLGLANINDRIPLAKNCNLEILNKFFRLTTKGISENELQYFTEYPLTSFIKDTDKNLPQCDVYLTGYYHPVSFTFYHHIKDTIINEFTFLPPFKEYAQNILQNFKSKKLNEIFVGVHVRRTDYITHHLKFLKAREAGMKYFTEAMKYYQNKFKSVLFVVVSDDRKWIQEKFTFNDTVIPPENPEPAYDLAILSECNHTILSYGSFGFWGAYLAGGETVYFDNFMHPSSTYLDEMPYNLTYLPTWVGISAMSEDYWDHFTGI